MTTEPGVRQLARRKGYLLRKSRQWKHVPNLDNCGEYMLVNFQNWVVLGERFDATLDDIDAYLKDGHCR